MPCDRCCNHTVAVGLPLARIVDCANAAAMYHATILVDLLATLFQQIRTSYHELLCLDCLGQRRENGQFIAFVTPPSGVLGLLLKALVFHLTVVNVRVPLIQHLLGERTTGRTVVLPDKICVMEELAQRLVPTGLKYKIIEDSELPSDRSFRNAWEIDEAELTDGVGA